MDIKSIKNAQFLSKLSGEELKQALLEQIEKDRVTKIQSIKDKVTRLIKVNPENNYLTIKDPNFIGFSAKKGKNYAECVNMGVETAKALFLDEEFVKQVQDALRA